MRKLPIWLLVFIFVTGVIALIPAHAAGTASATIISPTASAQAGPGVGFWSLGTLHGQEVVPVIGVTADQQWFQVNTRFGVAFLSLNDVTVSNASTVPVIDPGPFGTITGVVVSVRRGPGITSARVGTMSRGQQFFVLQQQQGTAWIQIRFRFGTGWVNSALTDFLVVVPKVVANNPTATPTAVPSSAPASGSSATPQATAVASATAPSAQGPVAIVNTAALNVHTGPSTAFTTIGTLSGGDVVQIVGRSQDGFWLEVNTIFGVGWINSQLVLTRNYFGQVPITSADAGTPDNTPTILVVTGTVNVRSGPNVAFAPITTVNSGTTLTILGQSPDHLWWLVDTAAGKGWISKALVQAKGAFNSVPVVQP